VQRLAEGLARRGHEVTVLTCRHSKSLLPEEVINGVKVVRMPPLVRISRGMVMPSFPIYAYRLIKQNDIVIINTPMLEASVVTFLSRRLGKKVFITHHGDLVLPAGALNRFIEMCVFAIYRSAAKSADIVIGYSDDYAEHSAYLSPFKGKVKTIYPPADIPMPNQERAEMLREQLELAGNKIIGYAGRFVEEKRPDRLLGAIPHLTKRIPNIKVVFAGEYQIKYENFYQRCKPLVDRYKDYLLLLGLINDEQRMADFYTMCDVLVLPSETECFALVQVEAMLCGTPVIVNDTPGARVPVRVTGMGEIVDCDDEQMLAEAIIRVIENRPSYLKPRSFIKSIFDADRMVEQYETLLHQVIKDEEK
jgi:glycosyltransferase involved in cell wall biosynthesis